VTRSRSPAWRGYRRFWDSNVESARDACIGIQNDYARQEHHIQILFTLRQDLGFAVRMLRRVDA